MPVKLNKIKGLMVDKKLEAYDGDLSSEYWNQALTEQGSRSITLDREKLAHIIFKFDYPEQEWSNFKTKWNDYYELSDAIIANEKELIVFKG